MGRVAIHHRRHRDGLDPESGVTIMSLITRTHRPERRGLVSRLRRQIATAPLTSPVLHALDDTPTPRLVATWGHSTSPHRLEMRWHFDR